MLLFCLPLHLVFIFIVLCYLHFTMKLELVTRRDVSFVELQRDKKHSLGITITDGTEEDSRPVVKNVKINSPAAKSFAVAKGDVILSVNGFSTTGKKSKDVRQMLDDAGSNVNLQVQYKTHESRIMGSCVYRNQRLTLRLQKIKGSFGFLLRKCSKYSFIMEYPIISNIKEGSPIYKRGHVQDGDRLLKIDNINLSWMSLSYIASLLQAKDVAEFTFEYSVRVVNFAEMDTKLDLEIDAPVADLGISFRLCDEECSVMYISSLRQGSVAERCGVFSEGDVILSINGIDTKNLTISKAYFLLRTVKKHRKLSFISNRRQVDTPNESGLSSTDDTISTESFISDIQSTDWKHVNTPVSPTFTFVDRQKCNFQNVCYIEQIQSVDKFQSILPIMSSLKQALSALTRQAFRGTQISVNQNCTSCNDIKHAVKLCTSCLARMNVNCAQSIDVLRDLVTHFVRFSSNMFDENDDQLVNISLKNVIHMLRETLPNIFHVPELKEKLCTLADKIVCADTSCSSCEKEVKAVVLIVKQLLLILSIRDNSAEFTDLAEHLVCRLLEVKFPCCGYSGCILNSDASESHYSSCEDLSETVCVDIEEENFSDTITSSHLKKNSETESNPISLESNFDTLQLKTEICHDYLKLTHIHSVSESKTSTSLKSSNESNRHCESCTETNTFPIEAAGETSLPSFVSDDLTESRTKKFFNNLKHTKIWSSLDSLIKPRRFSNIQNFRRSKNQPVYNNEETGNTVIINQNMCNFKNIKSAVTDLNQNAHSVSPNQYENTASSNESQNRTHTSYKKRKISHSKSKLYQSSINQPTRSNFCNYQKRVSSSSIAALNEENIADYNSGSTSSSSRCVDDQRYSAGSKETYPETNNLTLKNEGNGFGLGISDKSIINELPVINAIEPKSPADKEGVLKVGDRVIAINGAMTWNLSPEQFAVLKNEALASRTITLRVEFDVYDEKYMFGSFDVVLDKSLIVGLIYKDVKEGAPLKVKGVAKGSAAHRSGQVFPGDEISFVKYKKKVVFDPFPSSITKQRIVILTVMRYPKKVLDMDREVTSVSEVPNMRVSHSSPSYTNSVSDIPDLRAPHPTPTSSTRSVSQDTVLRALLNTSCQLDPNMRTPNPSLCSTNPSSEFTVLKIPRKTSSHRVPKLRAQSPSLSSMNSVSQDTVYRALPNISCHMVPNMRAPRQSLSSTNSASQDTVLQTLPKTSCHMIPNLRAPSPSLCSTNLVSEATVPKTSCYMDPISEVPNTRVPSPSLSSTNLSSEVTFLKVPRKTSCHKVPNMRAPSPSLSSTNSVSQDTVFQALPKTSCHMIPNLRTPSPSLCSTNSVSQDAILQALLKTSCHMIPNLRAPSPSLCSTNSVSEAKSSETSFSMDPIAEVPNMRVPNPSLRSTDQSSCSQRDENVPQNGEKFVVKKTSVRQSHNNSVIVEHEVTLYRDSRCFDFGILLAQSSVTGRGYVKDIRPDGPAHKSGVIEKNSRIVQVNGVLVQGNVHELFYRADDKVDLVIRRILPGDPDETQVKRIYRRKK